jgi:hypothetical protein
MLLTKTEQESILWKKIEARLNELLESDRRALEKISNSVEMTAVIRGRIKRTRELIAFGSATEVTENFDN